MNEAQKVQWLNHLKSNQDGHSGLNSKAYNKNSISKKKIPAKIQIT